MSSAIRIFHGDFGRVALLEMDAPLVSHAHHHCHVLIKAGGPDTAFRVRGVRYPLTDANAVLVNAWEEHAYTHDVVDGFHPVILALYLEPQWLSQHSRMLSGSAHPRFFPQTAIPLTLEQRRHAERVTTELWWSDDVAYDRLQEMLLDLVLSLLDNNVDEMPTAQLLETQRHHFRMDPRIRRALVHMRTNAAEITDMADVAASVDLSRAHFFELFKRCTGLSPVVYVNVLKMEQAFEALSSSGHNLSDISLDLGFSAQSHFTRFFKQHQGVVPSEYRRQIERPELQAGVQKNPTYR